MRIIAGTLKGRRLDAPTWDGLRPTSDKLRETLFNVISARIDGARVLDGYAGTGAVGLEALSRGASHVTFVERDPRAGRLIGENARRCGLADGYTILRADVTDALRRQVAGPFDIIFLDPPYAGVDWRQAVSMAARRLTAEGLLVFEHAAREPVADVAGARLVRQLRSGDSALAFFERAAPDAGGEPADEGRAEQGPGERNPGDAREEQS
jgi:16S rRNA (guanine966-N2)-methyltransferase